jgi:alkylhydroperoxidase family enzyme
VTVETPPRIPDPDRDRLAAETAGLLDLAAAATGHTPGTIAVLAHQPALLGPFLGWAAALALNGALPKRDHELLALRAAANCRSAFEWDEHVGFARGVGLTDDEIAMVKVGPDDPRWAPHEAALLRAADELGRECTISEVTWARLAACYDAAALVEIPFVVGQYTMLSMVANGLAIPS